VTKFISNRIQLNDSGPYKCRTGASRWKQLRLLRQCQSQIIELLYLLEIRQEHVEEIFDHQVRTKNPSDGLMIDGEQLKESFIVGVEISLNFLPIWLKCGDSFSDPSMTFITHASSHPCSLRAHNRDISLLYLR
jgi:hypothetical protein